MRSLRREAEKPMKNPAKSGLLRRGFRKLKHGFVTCAVAATMAFGMPLLERNAEAQPPRPLPTKKPEKEEKVQPPVQPPTKKPEKEEKARPARITTAKQIYKVPKGHETTIRDGNKTHNVYFLTETSKPVIKINGPAKLVLRLYPAVKRTRFSDKVREYVRKIECSSGPAGGTQAKSHFIGKTHMSNITHPDVASTLVIGTPMQFTTEVGKGRQEFRVLSPHGFLEIVSVKPIVQKVILVRPRPRFQLKTEGQTKKKTKKVRKKEPALLFSSSGERFQFRQFKLANTPEDLYRLGDAYLLNVLGHIPLGKTAVSMLVGAYVTSYGFVLDMPSSKTTFRSISANVSVGAGYRHGKHYVIASPFVGYRNIWGKLSANDGRADKNDDGKVEAGGAAGYSYNPYFSVLVSGSNNPFHPLTAKLHGELPRRWLKNQKPWLEFDADFNWFRTVKSLEQGGLVGGGEISGNEFDVRAIAGFGYGRYGVALHALAGVWTSISSDKKWATGIFGGKLSATFKGIDIQVSGLSSIEGVPLVLFSVNYRR